MGRVIAASMVWLGLGCAVAGGDSDGTPQLTTGAVGSTGSVDDGGDELPPGGDATTLPSGDSGGAAPGDGGSTGATTGDGSTGGATSSGGAASSGGGSDDGPTTGSESGATDSDASTTGGAAACEAIAEQASCEATDGCQWFGPADYGTCVTIPGGFTGSDSGFADGGFGDVCSGFTVDICAMTGFCVWNAMTGACESP